MENKSVVWLVCLALLLLPISFTAAYPSIHGFRSSWLTVNPQGVTFNDSTYNMTIGAWVNQTTAVPVSYFTGDVYFNRVINNYTLLSNGTYLNGSTWAN